MFAVAVVVVAVIHCSHNRTICIRNSICQARIKAAVDLITAIAIQMQAREYSTMAYPLPFIPFGKSESLCTVSHHSLC